MIATVTPATSTSRDISNAWKEMQTGKLCFPFSDDGRTDPETKIGEIKDQVRPAGWPVEVLSAGEGRCLAQLVVAEEHQNTFGTLHGGFTATVVDEVSTLALMTTGSGHPGVSVDLNVSYLKAANLGDKILIDAKTLKAGKRLAFLEVEIKKESGELIAKGSHTKFVSS
uniref:Acyl-coenzyme A thioesterase 13 n=1 Tax=Timema cristinae TaxID=61476 RepID=A0A7R9CTV8_TIMCR|nr:unnamed protein product [Timema cristinae]